MKTGTIYKITNNITNKLYIGQTTQGVSARWKQHIRTAKAGKGNLIGRSIRKYGHASFTITTVVDNVPHYFIDAFERYWINYYKTNTKSGYNCTAGGQGTKNCSSWNKGKTNCYSSETLEKMKTAKLGKTPTNLSQLIALSKQRKGNKHQLAKFATIYNHTTGDIIATSVCISEWAVVHGYSQGNLAATARGKRVHTKGIYARYNT